MGEVFLEILKNCSVPHLFAKVIKDTRNKIVKFEINHTNLDKIKLFSKYYNQLNKEDPYWLEVFEEAIISKKVNIKKYLPEIDKNLNIELYSPDNENVILWISIDYAEEVENCKHKENMCEAVLNSIPDGVFFKELDYKYIKYNDSYLDTIEKTDREIKDKTVVEIYDDINFTKKNMKIDKERELENLRMEFFANVSHEFRTPINLVFSSIQLIRMRNKKMNCYCANKRYIDIIEHNSYRLLKLINNLIDTTKINSGYCEHKPKNRDIVEFLKDVCLYVSNYGKEKGINFVFETDVEQKIISFDREQMERIILNLVSNSIKFTKKQGIVKIIVKCEKNMVNVIIRDNGIGIPEDKLENIFDTFIHVDDRMTKISEGSGIGLFIVKSLVEINGGTIEIKSKVNEGTEFIIKLPDKLVEKDKEAQLNFDIYEGNFEQSIYEKMKIEFSDIY